MLQIRLNLRKVIAIAICLVSSVTMFAQDIIVMKDGTEIKSVVQEVGVEIVKYKKYDNPDGPIYIKIKSEVSMIKYENGTKDVFSDVATPVPTVKRQRTTTNVEKITKDPIGVPQQSVTVPQPMQQEQTFDRKPQIGIKGGLNVANELASSGQNSSQTNARVGIHLGIFVAIPMSAKFDFQPELIYSMQGGSYKNGATYTDKIDYINLPLMFKWYVWQRRLSIDFGPQFGYMISAKVSSGGNSVSFYDSSELKKFDTSLALGLSFKLTDKVDIGLRGTAGLTNMVEGDVNYTNSVSQISVAFRF